VAAGEKGNLSRRHHGELEETGQKYNLNGISKNSKPASQRETYLCLYGEGSESNLKEKRGKRNFSVNVEKNYFKRSLKRKKQEII